MRVQRPIADGGLAGSAAFLSSESVFPSSRLLQIAQATLPSSEAEDILHHVYLASCASLEDLEHTVSYIVPSLADALLATERPLRLLVVDSIAAPVRSEYASSNSSLLQRGKDLSSFGQRLKALAAKYNLVILTVNQVSDVFSRQPNSLPPHRPDYDPTQRSPQANGFITNDLQLTYSSQSAFFAADRNNDKKQAALGLAWANLVDTRIMLSRRGRDKRTMALIFSPFAPEGFREFKITQAGVEAISRDEIPAVQVDGSQEIAMMQEGEREMDDDSFWKDVSDVDMIAALEGV